MIKIPMRYLIPPSPSSTLAAFIFALSVMMPPLVSRAGGAIRPRTLRVLEVLRRLDPSVVENNPSIRSVLLQTLDQLKGRPEFVELVSRFKISSQTKELLEIALQNPDTSAAVQAIDLVLKEDQLNPVRARILGPSGGALIGVLGRTGRRKAIDLLAEISLSQAPLPRRQACINALARSQGGSSRLIELVKSDGLSGELMATARTALLQSTYAGIRTEVAALFPQPSNLRENAPPPSIPELLQRKGDCRKGAAVFRRPDVACSRCHQIHGIGTDFGPNLSEIGDKLGADALYQAILEPSAGISFGYEGWEILDSSGDENTGIILSETEMEIVLKTQTGTTIRYGKEDILERRPLRLSLMPAGLYQTMRTQELVDLVAYLSSLRKGSSETKPRP